MALKRSISEITHSLHFKVASGVIVTVLLLSAVYFIWDYHFYRTQLLTELRESSESVSDVTLNSLLQLAMVGRHIELLQQGVERLSNSSEEVRTILILDPSGIVRFSSDRSLIGRRLERKGPGCITCHQEGKMPPRTSFIQSGRESLLRYAAPIPNRVECHSCHDPSRSLVGVLLVDHSTEGAQAQLRASLYEMLIKAGTTVLVILLVLGLLMNRTVISRIKKLTSATSQLASRSPKDLDLRSIEGDDEIGQLARSFEEMAQRLNRSFRELEEKERIRVSLVQRLVRSQEEERKTLSRELHDQLGQSLSALLVASKTIFSEDSPSKETLADRRKDFEGRIRQLIEDVHQLAWQMRPSILDDYGLEKALARYVEETSTRSGIAIDFQQTTPNGVERLPHWLETTLYRVAQEAVTNLIRHSEATQSSVVLMRNRESVTLLIDDNGVGFVPEDVVPSSQRGLGLVGMRERVSECGGTLDIESARMKGTTVRVRIPLGQTLKWQSV
ncbi:MAG: HAMP domain-containing protein [Acidobacteriota bacterium]